MNSLSMIVSAATLAVAVLAPSDAFAQDRTRVHAGVEGGLGLLVAPEIGFGAVSAGATGEIGVQVNDYVGLYWAPQADLLFGGNGFGGNLAMAAMVEISPVDHFSFGVGPDVGVFGLIGDGGVAGGINYGGRASVELHPYVDSSRSGARKAFSIGLDLRVLGGDVGFHRRWMSEQNDSGPLRQGRPKAPLGPSTWHESFLTTSGSDSGDVLFHPSVTVGYTVF